MDIKIQTILRMLYEESFHISILFPEDSNETVTLTAGNVVNTFSAWAEIVDNNAVTLSSKFVSSGHISSIIVEGASVKDKRYVLEIAYGADKIVVARARGISETVLVGHVGQEEMRTIEIPN